MADGDSTASARATLNALYKIAYTTAHPSTCLPPHLPAVPEGGRMIIIGAGNGSDPINTAGTGRPDGRRP